MKRITIQVSKATAVNLHELAGRCMAAQGSSDDFTSHGPLTVSSLLAMLVEDAGMVVNRPGSCEGASIAQVFISHGDEV